MSGSVLKNFWVQPLCFCSMSAGDKILCADRCRANDKLTVKNSWKGEEKRKKVTSRGFYLSLVFREDSVYFE